MLIHDLLMLLFHDFELGKYQTFFTKYIWFPPSVNIPLVTPLRLIVVPEKKIEAII